MREQITDILREQILRAEIVPGERIIEEEVAKKYQVSRGPVREALRQLEEEGLITYMPHRGCEVKILTEEEMRESYLIRCTLEGLAVRIYRGRVSEDGFRKMEECIRRMREAAVEKNLYEIVRADEDFHMSIVEESGSEKLLKMWKLLAGANTATYYTMKTKGLMPYDVLGDNHQRILALFREEADAEEIVRMISEHYMVVPQNLHDAGGLK